MGPGLHVFAVGDVVKLRSGGWRMTVEALAEDDSVHVITVTRDAVTRLRVPCACLVHSEDRAA